MVCTHCNPELIAGPPSKIVLIVIDVVLVFIIVDEFDDKVKVKVSLEQAMKTQRRIRGIALHFL